MEHQLFAHVPVEDRAQYLSDNCDRVEELEYLKPYTAEELAEMKDELSTVSIRINDVEEEKKEVIKGFKETLDPLQKKRKHILKGLRQKAQLVTERCFTFIDPHTAMVGFYNAEGQLVSSRKAKPGEFQRSIFSVTRDAEERTGTNG